MSRRAKMTAREKRSEWVLHCAIDQCHIRRIQPTRDAALKDACSQLLQGHAVNRIVGPNRTITAERIKDWCAKHARGSLPRCNGSRDLPDAASGPCHDAQAVMTT
jgi:hypothetical protein